MRRDSDEAGESAEGSEHVDGFPLVDCRTSLVVVS
jgi:hypothetical protein